jgi:type II secretory pathway pseudopilin PulG
MAGATLLEVMLVLSIIALIILMSVRYYQSTTTASQTEQTMGIVSAITAAADNLSLGTAGGYSNVTAANMSSVIGSANMNSPWGGTITFGSGNTTSYSVTIPKPTAAVCTTIIIKLKANTKFTDVSCTGGGNLTYTYNSTC